MLVGGPAGGPDPPIKPIITRAKSNCLLANLQTSLGLAKEEQLQKRMDTKFGQRLSFMAHPHHAVCGFSAGHP